MKTKFSFSLSTLLSIAIFSTITLCQCSSTPKAPAGDVAKDTAKDSAQDPMVIQVNAPVNPFDAVEKKIAAIQAESEMPALQVLVFERSKIKYKYSKGLRAVSFDREVGSHDKFHLGSATKAFTAVLIAQMIDLKLLDWDTPLKNLVPKDIPLNEKNRDTTIEMLMSHRAGLTDLQDLQNKKLFPQLFSIKDTKAARQRLVKAILAAPTKFTPGSKTEYSNSAFVLLGWILEQKTNFQWEELVKNKIFLPLVMDSCGFGPQAAPLTAAVTSPDQPWGHTLNRKGELEAVKPGPTADNPAAIGPAGTIHCSAEDWVKFLEMISQGFYHESTFLKEETFARMLANAPNSPFTYGAFLRFERSWAAGTALAINGSNTYNYAFAAMAPSRELIFVILTNSGTKKAEHGATKILQMLTEMK
jgi:CubicO group peptidase (beta-lactamase class C family)